MKALFTVQMNKRFLTITIFFLFGILSAMASGSLLKSTNNTEQISLTEDIPQGVKIVITKDTTDKALEEIAKEMQEQGVSFSYSNIVRNTQGEITGIAIFYTYKKNRSQYKVSSETPINTIVISSDGNSVSVRAAGSGNQLTIDQDGAYKSAVIDKNKKTTEERMAAMEERREEMHEKMDKRMDKMNAKREEMKEHRSDMKNQFGSNSNNLKKITKDSSDKDLENLKEEFSAEGVIFTYSGLKRNEAGEIMKINVKLDDQKGSVSKSNFRNNKSPIKTIILDTKEGTSITKSEQ